MLVFVTLTANKIQLTGLSPAQHCSRIRQLLFSNLGKVTSNPEGFVIFISHSTLTAGIVLNFWHDSLLPDPLQFIIHKWPYHSMLCSLHGDSVVKKKETRTSYVKLLYNSDSQTDSIKCRPSFCLAKVTVICDVTPFSVGLDGVTSKKTSLFPDCENLKYSKFRFSLFYERFGLKIEFYRLKAKEILWHYSLGIGGVAFWMRAEKHCRN